MDALKYKQTNTSWIVLHNTLRVDIPCLFSQ